MGSHDNIRLCFKLVLVFFDFLLFFNFFVFSASFLKKNKLICNKAMKKEGMNLLPRAIFCFQKFVTYCKGGVSSPQLFSIHK